MNEAMPLHDVARLAGVEPDQVHRSLQTLGLRGTTAAVHPGLVPLALHLDPVAWQRAVVDRAIADAEAGVAPRRAACPATSPHARMTAAPTHLVPVVIAHPALHRA